jgi:hypothetical protein
VTPGWSLTEGQATVELVTAELVTIELGPIELGTVEVMVAPSTKAVPRGLHPARRAVVDA